MTDDLVKQWDAAVSATQDATQHAFAVADKMADRIEALEREKREAALDALAAHGQAHDAYEAQLKAEARLAKAVEALREIAAEASVRVETKKHGGISHKKLYEGWRKLAVKRIDTARAVLAEIEGGKKDD